MSEGVENALYLATNKKYIPSAMREYPEKIIKNNGADFAHKRPRENIRVILNAPPEDYGKGIYPKSLNSSNVIRNAV